MPGKGNRLEHTQGVWGMGALSSIGRGPVEWAPGGETETGWKRDFGYITEGNSSAHWQLQLLLVPQHFNVALWAGVGFSNYHVKKLPGILTAGDDLPCANYRVWPPQVSLCALRQGTPVLLGQIIGAFLEGRGQFLLARNKSRLQRNCKATYEDVLKQPGRPWPEKYFLEKCNNNNTMLLT